MRDKIVTKWCNLTCKLSVKRTQKYEAKTVSGTSWWIDRPDMYMVGCIHGFGWVGLGRLGCHFFVFGGLLRWANWLDGDWST